jgi:hypothetical protein
MAGKHDVAEIGIADALGARLVLERVKTLSVYDPREHVVAKLQRQFADAHAFAARWHEVLTAPTTRKFDSIYSIDFLQYFSPDEEEAFVGNLQASLQSFGFALIGCPAFGRPDASAECPAEAERAPRTTLFPQRGALEPSTTENSREARVYRRSGEELVALMKQYFHNVFGFSLIEQSVRSGIYRDAQHVFALGCGKK